MSIIGTADEIISVSDVTKKFKDVREKILQYGKCVVFNHNKPELVFMSFDHYSMMLEIIEHYDNFQNISQAEGDEIVSEEEFEKQTGFNLN